MAVPANHVRLLDEAKDQARLRSVYHVTEEFLVRSRCWRGLLFSVVIVVVVVGCCRLLLLLLLLLVPSLCVVGCCCCYWCRYLLVYVLSVVVDHSVTDHREYYHAIQANASEMVSSVDVKTLPSWAIPWECL